MYSSFTSPIREVWLKNSSSVKPPEAGLKAISFSDLIFPAFLHWETEARVGNTSNTSAPSSQYCRASDLLVCSNERIKGLRHPTLFLLQHRLDSAYRGTSSNTPRKKPRHMQEQHNTNDVRTRPLTW